MKDLAPQIIAGLVAIAAIASVTLLAYVDKIDGQTAVALLSALVGAGVVHVSRST